MQREYDLKKMKVKRRGILPELQAEAVDKNTKVRITISLDQDVVGYYKHIAEAPGALPYQTQINQALRKTMAQDERELIKIELLKDRDFIQQVAERVKLSV